MSRFDQREAPPPGETETLNKSASTPTTNKPKDNRPTQYQRVLRSLVENDEVCGHRTWYGEMMIPRFGAHLNRAKKKGIRWTKRPCDRHDHEGTAYLYRIESVPAKPEGEPCEACGGILAHVSSCRVAHIEDAGTLPFASEGSR